MWLSAINRDLTKYKNTTLSSTGDQGQEIEVGLGYVTGMEEGQYVVEDDQQNEFLLFHPEVDVSEIKPPCAVASWQDPSNNEWMWAVAEITSPSTFKIVGKHHVEPEPH
ncbi:hypothetical protein KWAN_137 [Erwinia phage vB_EamM_Kwan]|jgi:hypothetical protein|uniref:Uncharacterized protein n=1 Tax=Erwinia phage vB_EamM_Kwan TaxID=1883374 RepID=A0A1B2IE10_9CAUD|nr:hypothetical protein BIZ80_gp162 [Erwinia phage vB_EamM_Kwan]ANZ49489.1 hypothetical protein KWAN_137 [Erwinia phage vB_EamM_Kwan]